MNKMLINRANIETQWPDIADKLMNRFSRLTNADLNFLEGRQEDLLDRIQFRLNKSREEVLTLISTL